MDYGTVIGIICASLNHDISDDLEWPLKVISVIYLLLYFVHAPDAQSVCDS